MIVDLSIRKARFSDASAMSACVQEAYQHYISRIGKPPGPMLDDYSKVIDQHHAYVAERNEQIVGILVLIRKKNSILLDNVAVNPKYKGMGLGGRLIAFAESEARNQGYKYLDLYTHECMKENIKMYKRLGYVETEHRVEKGYRRVYMQKVL